MSGLTLPGALISAARGRHAFTVVDDAGVARDLPAEDLLAGARRAAAGLRDLGLRPGDRVGILHPEPGPFLRGFFAAAVAGMVPVPLAPPTRLGEIDGWTRQLCRLVASARVSLLLAPSDLRKLMGQVLAACPRLRGIVEPEDLDGAPVDPASPAMSDLAILQMTSGSTGDPKGAAITHASLHANTGAIADGLGVGPSDVGVSWLPLHHDMGLVGMVLAALYRGSRTVLLPPLSFLKRPTSWLRALSTHGGTISFAPSFAYALCARRVSDADLAGLDLSRWRVAGCGAEPVRPGDLRAFARRMAAAGFSERAFLPCYGMAEHTLAVTFPRVGEGLRQSPAGHVSCGAPFPGHVLRILDGAGREVPEGVEGEIHVAGPSLMTGYDLPGGAPGAGLRDGLLPTGDLGYLLHGELHVCGRQKDVLIVHGRNVHPQDIEAAVGELPGVRRGSVAAVRVGAYGEGQERIVVLAECRGASAPEGLDQAVRRTVAEGFGVRVHEVVTLPPGTLPKTSSGKLRRSRVRELHERGELAPPPRPSAALVRQRLSSQWGYLRAAVVRAAGVA